MARVDTGYWCRLFVRKNIPRFTKAVLKLVRLVFHTFTKHLRYISNRTRTLYYDTQQVSARIIPNAHHLKATYMILTRACQKHTLLPKFHFRYISGYLVLHTRHRNIPHWRSRCCSPSTARLASACSAKQNIDEPDTSLPHSNYKFKLMLVRYLWKTRKYYTQRVLQQN